MDYDLVLAGGLIVDGTGRPGRQGSVGVRGGRIAEVVGGGKTLKGRNVIDLDGLVLAPGFVDIHSHSDLSLLANRTAASSVLQGITTQLGGNCGWSLAPCHKKVAEELILPMVSSSAGEGSDRAIDFSWATVGEFLDKLEETPIGMNIATLVGQHVVRGYVMGREDRLPTEAELNQMRRLVRQAMADGAFGLSTQRSLFPTADFQEMVELVAEVADARGLYVCHLLSQDAGVSESVREVTEIGRLTGCAVQVTHHKVCTKPCWGNAQESLEIIEQARAEGVDVMLDAYPYPYTSITDMSRLLPPWLLQDGREAGALRLRDAETRRKVLAEIETARRRPRAESDDVSASVYVRHDLKTSGIVYCRNTHRYEGLDVGELAAEKGIGLIEACLELLAENDLMVKTAGIMSQSDVDQIITHPLNMISTDCSVSDKVSFSGFSSVHPRTYGNYPQFLQKYVFQDCVLTLEEAIHKCAQMPARRMGLVDRGVISKGAWADLVAFDPAEIRDQATPENPVCPPSGIHYVLVNGELVVNRRSLRGAFPGMVLRKRR